MSAPCPKCGYIRRPTDNAPEYECPRCGIVYAKYLKALHEKAAAADHARTDTPQPPGPPHTKSKFPRPKVVGSICATLFALWVIGHLGSGPPAGMPKGEVAPAPKPAPPPRPAKTAEPPPKTAAQLEADRISALEMAAREVCFAAIKANAKFPSSVDIFWFTGTATARQGNATLVKAAFTSKNALGNDLPFYGLCRVNDTGQLEHFSQTAR